MWYKLYSSQTGHHISTGTSGHIRDTRLGNQQLAIAELSAATKHSIDFNRTEVITHICTYHPCIIREAIKIAKHPHNFNCGDKYR
jgi:hypothetical protein